MLRLVAFATVLGAAGLAFGQALPATVPGNAGSQWFLGNSGGTSNGQPVGGTANGSPGLTIVDSSIGSQGDAYDNAFLLWVNGSVYADAGPLTQTNVPGFGTMHQGSPQSLGGILTTYQYAVFNNGGNRAIVRAYATLTSQPGAVQTVQLSLAHNVGSDGSTQILSTSNVPAGGPGSFTPASRWVVSDDFSTTAGDPANTFVFWGPGAPVTPSGASTTVFNAAGTEGYLSTFNLTLQPGQTVGFLFFGEITPTGAGALSTVSTFDTLASVGAAGLLAGLTSAEIAQTVNWVPTPGTAGVMLMGGVLLARRRRA